jgi:hypothetical protein
MSHQTSDTLRPCKKCNFARSTLKFHSHSSGNFWWFRQCDNCGYTSEANGLEELANSNWNTRADSAPKGEGSNFNQEQIERFIANHPDKPTPPAGDTKSSSHLGDSSTHLPGNSQHLQTRETKIQRYHIDRDGDEYPSEFGQFVFFADHAIDKKAAISAAVSKYRDAVKELIQHIRVNTWHRYNCLASRSLRACTCGYNASIDRAAKLEELTR